MLKGTFYNENQQRKAPAIQVFAHINNHVQRYQVFENYGAVPAIATPPPRRRSPDTSTRVPICPDVGVMADTIDASRYDLYMATIAKANRCLLWDIVTRSTMSAFANNYSHLDLGNFSRPAYQIKSN